MSTQRTKGASFIVGAQMLICVLTAGFVLTHFHHGSKKPQVLLPAAHYGSVSTAHTLLLTVRERQENPRVLLHGAAVMAPMMNVGPGPQNTTAPSMMQWRIVNERGVTVAQGPMPKNAETIFANGGFAVHSANSVYFLYGMPTWVLSVQATASDRKIAGHYVLEQLDYGRPVYRNFDVAAAG